MIELTNIKREGDILSATAITVEIEPKTFEVAINVATLDIVKPTVDRLDTDMYTTIAKLFKLVEPEIANTIKQLPESTGSTWY